MSKNRLLRLNEQLKREISDIVRRDVRDPRVGSLTVTRVDTAPDLWMARVYVRLPGGEEERAMTMEGLRAAAPFIRRALGSGLHIRRVPELRFQEDQSLDHAVRIERVLKGLAEERRGADLGPSPTASEEPE